MTEDNDHGGSYPGDSFPPPPPVDSPTGVDSGGSTRLGVALGLVGALLASFSPILFSFLDAGLFAGLFVLPVLLVIAIALAVKRSTRRTGIGMLSGFAVGLVVSAGTCLYWLSTADFG